MKIAYMLGSLNRGGTETLLLDCFRNKAQAPFDFIGIYRKEGQLSNDFRTSQVPLFKLCPKHPLDVGYFSRLRKLIHSQQISILHAQQPLDALYARIATLFMSVRVVLTLHGYDAGFKTTDRIILRWAIHWSDIILFVSNAQKAYYQRQYSLPTKKVQTLYNGISFVKLDKAKVTDIRQELHLPKEVMLLGSVGNFVPGRDQMTLCRFLKRLHETNVDFRFLFVGAKSKVEPDRFEECVQFCAENNLSSDVFFLGSREDVPSILKQLDAFLYASDHDTFGIAVIEAMASSVPVFVNDWEVMREITDDGVYANLYPTKQEEELFRQFMDFTANTTTYKQQAQKASAWVRKNYSIQNHQINMSNIYRSIGSTPEEK